MNLLEVKNLAVNYGAVMAIEGVSLRVEKNEIVALLGPNGAGKSTTLKAICGLLGAQSGRITAGDIDFDGFSIKELRTDQLVKRGLILVPEGRHIFASMSVMENLEMGAFTRQDKNAVRGDIDKVFAMFPRLQERWRQKAGTLSSGEQQMLAIGRALMLRPKLLMADEPSLGLSPNYVEAIFDKFEEIKKSGVSILLVEQNAAMALDVADRAYIFEIGKIVLDGMADDLVNEPKVRQAFLGG